MLETSQWTGEVNHNQQWYQYMKVISTSAIVQLYFDISWPSGAARGQIKGTSNVVWNILHILWYTNHICEIDMFCSRMILRAKNSTMWTAVRRLNATHLLVIETVVESFSYFGPLFFFLLKGYLKIPDTVIYSKGNVFISNKLMKR